MIRGPRAKGVFGSGFQLFSESLLTVGVVLFAAPFIALLFYSSMNSDDFAKAALAFFSVRQPGVLHITWLYYAYSSGRWLTTILQSFVMSKVNMITYYGWLLLVIMLSNIAALAYFFVSFLRVSRARALLAAGLFYAVWLSNAATPIEGVFWLTEAFEYQVSLTAILILAGLLCKQKQTLWSYLGIAALAICIPGLHELAGVFVCVCLVAGVIALQLQKLGGRQWWLALGLATLSLAAVMLCPGKALEFATGHNTPWTFGHVFFYAKRTTQHGIDWILNPAVLLYGFCTSFLLRPRDDLSEGREFAPPRWLALVGLVVMTVLLAEFAGSEMASGYGAFPPRTVGWFQFIFWLLMVCVMHTGLPEITRVRLSPVSQTALSMLLVVSLLGSGNFHLAVTDWRGPARPYLESSVARLRERGDSLQFGPLPRRPALFRQSFLSASDPKCWVNEVMALYLGAKSVVVTDPNEDWTCPEGETGP